MAGVHGVDANLLVPLRALLTERSVTAAAVATTTSQPAMSAALARLRAHYGDDLLVRAGRGYRLTALAEDLLPQADAALDAVQEFLGHGARFTPATSTRRFTVSGSDYALTVLVEPLLAVVRRQAPGVTIAYDAVPEPHADLLAHLLRRDVLVGAMGYGFPGSRQVVLSDRFVCVVSAANPRLRDGRLTLADLADLPHVAAFGGRRSTPVDAVLAEAGIVPRVEVVVEGLLSLPFAVSGTDLCAFVPERLLQRCPDGLGLAVAEVDLPDPELAEAAHWHPSRDGDPALLWLRGVLRDVSTALGHRPAR